MFRLLVAVSIAMVVGVTPAWPAPPTLAGKTTLRGDSSGLMVVHLDRPLRVVPEVESPERPARLAIDGPGRIRGAALRAVARNASDGSRAEVVTFSDVDGGASTSANTSTLPAGDYRFYLLIDQGPATAVLTAPGLPGEAQFATAVPIPAETGAIEFRATSTPGELVGGRAGTLASDGIAYLHLQAGFDARVGRGEMCFYPQGDEAAGEEAYSRSCPGGESSYSPVSDTYAFGSTTWTFRASSGPARIGLGGNFQALPGPPDVQATAGWFSFEPVAAAGPISPTLPPTAAEATPPPEGGRVAFVGRRARLRGTSAVLRLLCPGAAGCAAHARTMPRGRASRVRIAAGRSTSVRVQLSASQRRAIRHRRQIRIRVAIAGTDAAGRRYLVEQRIRLERS